jgi:DNA-directed RNA polymerase subunit L
MNLKILERTRKSILLEIEGEGHTFANLLRTILHNRKNVEEAAYFIKHPFLSSPQVYLKTNGIEPPMKALKQATLTIVKDAKECRQLLLAALAKTPKKG